jgi:hypothetical protein
MTRDKGPFSPAHPWPRAGWGALAVILGISLVLGFIVLSRYQQNGEPQSAAASALLPMSNRRARLSHRCARRRWLLGPAARSIRLLPATSRMAPSSR